MTTFHFQTHVSDSGEIVLPVSAKNLYGKNVVVDIGTDDGGNSMKDSSRKRSFEELCGVWGKEEDREDIDQMVAAIHEGRLLGTEREPL
jgi:hypothetical protein